MPNHCVLCGGVLDIDRGMLCWGCERISQTVHQINRFVEPEGWALVWHTGDLGHDEVMIQMDDDAQVFTDDASAQAHVKRLAREGSAIHVLALQIVN